MWACAPSSDLRRWAAVLAVALLPALPAAAQPPQRVVSMNLCTDQLALMLATPGQLVSVSWLAHDSAVPALAQAARALPANRGTAEDIFLLRPDLVLAGQFTTGATVAMLQRLGVPVVRFPIEARLDDVPPALRAMGAALGAEAQAEALVAKFQADRAAIAAHVAARFDAEPRDRAVLYSARGFTGGPDGLAGDILRAAGLDNIATELGLTWGGHVPLESLILAAPDMLVAARPGRTGHSEAQALLSHPALTELAGRARAFALSDRDWVCGTPHVLDAVARLLDAREAGE
jgi:iron complex transport system substrate-binding protein